MQVVETKARKQIITWHNSAEETPETGRDCLVEAASGYFAVMHLENITDGYYKYYWYPGGLPLESSRTWAYLQQDGGAEAVTIGE